MQRRDYMNTAAYYRSSTKIQENSIEMQRQTVFNSSIKNAIPVDQEYIDESVSARKLPIEQRRGISKLLKDIESGKVHCLYVYKRDRLARKAIEYMKIYHLLKSREILVIFTADNEPPIQYSPIGELFELMMAGIIEREGDQIVERIKETIKAKFEKGKNPGKLPYGYKKDSVTKDIICIDSELSQVQYIFSEILSKSHRSLSSMKDKLNSAGHLKNNKPWTMQAIRKVLSDPTYMGTRILHIAGEEIKSRYDQLSILDEKDWLEAQEILHSIDPKSQANKITPTKENFLLEGFLYCSKCHSLLQGNKARIKNNLKYMCKEHKDIYVNKESIEEQIFEYSTQFFKKLINTHFDEFFARYNKKAIQGLDKQSSLLRQQIDLLSSKINKYTKEWLAEKSEQVKSRLQDVLTTEYNRLEKLKNTLEKQTNEKEQLKNLTPRIKMVNNKMANLSVMENINKDELIEIYHETISKITVSEYGIDILFKHPFLNVREIRKDAAI